MRPASSGRTDETHCARRHRRWITSDCHGSAACPRNLHVYKHSAARPSARPPAVAHAVPPPAHPSERARARARAPYEKTDNGAVAAVTVATARAGRFCVCSHTGHAPLGSILTSNTGPARARSPVRPPLIAGARQWRRLYGGGTGRVYNITPTAAFITHTSARWGEISLFLSSALFFYAARIPATPPRSREIIIYRIIRTVKPNNIYIYIPHNNKNIRV